MGEIVAIWIKRFKRGPMDAVADARLVAGRGIVGNANQGGKRQITLIDEARWREAAEEIGVDVSPAARRANVMLRGVDLERSHRRLLRIGDCVVRTRAIRTTFTSAGTPWSADEDARLGQEFDKGMTIAQIALQHGRTSAAITSRLTKLGRIDPASVKSRSPVAAAS